MEFKKTVAGISAAAIAVTQVAAVIPMGAFAAEEPVASNVQFALKYAASTTKGDVKADASAKKVTLTSDAITASTDETGLGFSYSGEISGTDFAEGDKYTFTASNLTVVATEKDTVVADAPKTVWENTADLDSTTTAGKLEVANAGNAGDVVTITYTKGDNDIKVASDSGDITATSSTETTFTFTLDAASAEKFVISGDGVEVTSVTVKTTQERTLSSGLTIDNGGTEEITLDPDDINTSDYDTNTVVVNYEQSGIDASAPACDISVSGDGVTNSVTTGSTLTFNLEQGTTKFTLTGTNCSVTSIVLTSVKTADLNKSGIIEDTTTPGETVTVEKTEFANAKEGDKLVVTYAAKENETANVVLAAGSTSIATLTTETEVTLTADQAAALKQNDLTVSGSNATVSKVEFISKGSTTKGKEVTLFDTTPSVVWSQTWDGSEWTYDPSTAISTDKLAEGSVGTVGAFKNAYDNITVTWDRLTATKTVPDEPTEVTADLGYTNADGLDLSKNILKINKADVEEDGTITVALKETITSEIVLKDSDGAELAKAAPETDATSVVFTLTAEQAEKISAGGFSVTGTEGLVTGVTYKAKEVVKPTVTTEEVDYPLYDVSYDLSAKALKVGAYPFKTGDSVIVKLSSAITSKVQLYKADGETLIKEEDVVSDEGDNTVTFKLSEEEAAEITANGFVIKGTEGTVTQLSFDKSKKLGSFDNGTAVALSELKDKGVKNARVTFNVTKYDSNGYATFNIVTNCDSGYKEYKLATEKQYENGAGQSWQANEKITKTGETTAVVELDLTGDELNFYDIELLTDNYDVLNGELVKVEFLDADGAVVKTYPESTPVQPGDDDKDSVEIWSGNTDLGGWETNLSDIPACSKAVKDGVLTIEYTVNAGAEYAQLQLKDNGADNGWEWSDVTDVINLSLTSTSNSITLTEEAAATVKNGRLIVAGANVTVTSIKYKAPASAGDDDTKETVLFEGSTDMGTEWGASETIAAFAAQKGGTITAEFTEGTTEYWQLKFMDGGWKQLTAPKVNQWGSVELGSKATTYSFVLNSKDAKAISESGMVVSGYGVTLKKLTYTAPTGEVEEDKIDINTKNFPDTNFRKVLARYDTDGDKKLSESEIAAITDLGNTKADDKYKDEASDLAKVGKFDGIENLTALKTLIVNNNTQKNFKALDLSANTELVHLDVSGCKNLATLTLPDTNTIEKLQLQNTAISAIDVAKFTALTVLNVSDTKIETLNVEANTALETLALANTAVAELDVKANTALTELDAANCKLTTIDVSANKALEKLDVSGNQLIALDLTGLTALTADGFKADGNKRNIGTVVDGKYAIADLGLEADKMTVTTKGVTLDDGTLTGITGEVTYSYKTGLTDEGLETVTFTLAPEKVTSFNYYVSDGKSEPVICETWNDVLKAINDKNVDYTVMIAKDVSVDKLTFPTAAKAKSVSISSIDRNALTITTKSASVTLPTEVKLANVNINVVDNNGKQAKSFTLSASKDLTIDNLTIKADKAVIKGAAKSTLTVGGLMPGSVKVAGAEITGFGTVAVPDGHEVTLDKTVKVKDLKIGGGATVEFGSNSVTFTNIIAGEESSIKYDTADYNPVAVTGNITGTVKVGIEYTVEGEPTQGEGVPTYTDVTTFAKDDVVLVSKTANLANIDVTDSVPDDADYTLGRVGSDIKVMEATMTLNGVKFSQWSDVLATIAANAKADKAAAETTDYIVELSKDLNANGALKMPAAKTFHALTIMSEQGVSTVPTVTFTGNISLTGATTFSGVKLDSVKNGKSADFTISAGKNFLNMYNVTTGANIKSITSSGEVNLCGVTAAAVNAATINVSTAPSNSIDASDATVDGVWEGAAIDASSVTVTGNLTAKTALNLVGDDASLTVKGIVNAAQISAGTDSAVLVVYTQAKGKNALVIGKNGIANDSEQIKFVLADPATGKTAHITDSLVLGTIAGPYADQFAPSSDNLEPTDEYLIIKDNKKLIAVPKENSDKQEYLVKVTVNGKAAYYKSLDEAIKDISATGSKNDNVVITVTQDMFKGSVAKLPLPTAGKYGILTYTATSDVTINVTSDLTLTGDLVLDENVALNKVDKSGTVLPISVNVGKYALTANSALSAKTASADNTTKDGGSVTDTNSVSQLTNISGAGKFVTDVDVEVAGKVNGTTLVLDGNTVTLGEKATFNASVDTTSESTLAYTNAKNVKFVSVTGEGLKIAGEFAADATVANITGDYTKDAVVIEGDLKVVRSGSTLKAVKAEKVVEVEAYENEFNDVNPLAVRTYDSLASAINDISRIKDKTMVYVVPVKADDVITLPKANTYLGIKFDSAEAVTVKTVKDLALTGNLIIDSNVTVKKSDGKAISVNVGNYVLSVFGKVDPDANGVSQFNNISGKGGFAVFGKANVSGKVNVGTIFIEDLELGSKSTFSASTIVVEKIGTLKYPASIAKNVKLGKVENNCVLNLNVEGIKEGEQVAAPLNNFGAEAGQIIINDDDTFFAVRSGSKIVAVKEDSAFVVSFGDEERAYATYADAIADINKINSKTTDYQILLPANANITTLTLPAKNKYQSITLCANDLLTVKLTKDVALTGNLIVGENVILQKNEGGDNDVLKFTSPKDSKTKKALYTVEAADGGVIVNGTLNGEKIDSPAKPVTKEIELGGEVGEFDLSNNNVLKVKKAEVAEGGTIKVTLKENVTSDIVLKDSEGNTLATATPEDTTVTFTLTADMASEITANGFTVKGEEGIVTGVTYTAPAEPDPIPEQKLTVEGTLPFGNKEVDLSTNILKIAKTNVAENNTIIVTLKANVTSDIVLKDSEGNTLATATPEDTTVTFTLDADMASKITANGFTVEGEAGIVTGVTSSGMDVTGDVEE